MTSKVAFSVNMFDALPSGLVGCIVADALIKNKMVTVASVRLKTSGEHEVLMKLGNNTLQGSDLKAIQEAIDGLQDRIEKWDQTGVLENE